MSKKKYRPSLRLRVERFLHETKWWFLHRFHPSHRYHVIHTGLEPGWRDRDYLMEHLIVKLLIDFVEDEKPYDHFDTVESVNAAEWIRLKELYNFFKEHKVYDLEHDDLTEKLVEIVKLRGMLWT